MTGKDHEDEDIIVRIYSEWDLRGNPVDNLKLIQSYISNHITIMYTKTEVQYVFRVQCYVVNQINSKMKRVHVLSLSLLLFQSISLIFGLLPLFLVDRWFPGYCSSKWCPLMGIFNLTLTRRFIGITIWVCFDVRIQRNLGQFYRLL